MELKPELLLVGSPACEWLPFAQKAIVSKGDAYVIPSHGRGHGIGLGDATQALPVAFEPSGDANQSFFIRWAHDRELSLEVNHRRFKPGASLSSWVSIDRSGEAKPQMAVRFLGHPDGTISPARAPHLVIGVNPAGESKTASC